MLNETKEIFSLTFSLVFIIKSYYLFSPICTDYLKQMDTYVYKCKNLPIDLKIWMSIIETDRCNLKILATLSSIPKHVDTEHTMI